MPKPPTRQLRYWVKYWPAVGVAVHQVMPWVVIRRRKQYLGQFPILSRSYTRSAAREICRALSSKGKP